MSYTTLFIVPKTGSIIPYNEYQNAHGSARVIWEALKQKHSNGETDIYSSESPFWSLWKSHTLKEYEAACLFLTFRQTILLREDFQVMAEYLDQFHQEFYSENQLSHLSKMANDLRELLNKRVFGVCYNWTSVDACGWTTPDRRFTKTEVARLRPYDISKDHRHYFHFGKEYTSGRFQLEVV